MSLWSEIAFVIAGLFFGQWLLLKRPAAAHVPTVSFEAEFDRPIGVSSTIVATQPQKSSTALIETVQADAGAPQVNETELTAAQPPQTKAIFGRFPRFRVTSSHEEDSATEVAAHSAPAIADAAVTRPVDEPVPPEVAIVVGAIEEPIALKRGFWSRFRSRKAASEPIVHTHDHIIESIVMENSEPIAAPILEEPLLLSAPTSSEAQRVVAEELPAPTLVDDEESDAVLERTLGISPRRQRELAAQVERGDAAIVAEPARIVPEVTASVDAVAESNAAVEQALRRASAWACEATGMSTAKPMEVDKRRRLLAFYLDQLEDPDMRAVVERVAREDPDLAPMAKNALAAAA